MFSDDLWDYPIARLDRRRFPTTRCPYCSTGILRDIDGGQCLCPYCLTKLMWHTSRGVDIFIVDYAIKETLDSMGLITRVKQWDRSDLSPEQIEALEKNTIKDKSRVCLALIRSLNNRMVEIELEKEVVCSRMKVSLPSTLRFSVDDTICKTLANKYGIFVNRIPSEIYVEISDLGYDSCDSLV